MKKSFGVRPLTAVVSKLLLILVYVGVVLVSFAHLFLKQDNPVR